MSDRPTQAGFHKLSCPCGADIRIDARSTKRIVACPQCHLTLDFVVSMDPRTRKPRVALVMSADSLKPPPAPVKPKTAKVRTVRPPLANARPGMVTAPCSCGATLEIEADELAGDKTCDSCDTAYHMVVKLDRETGQKSAILVPKGPLPGRKPKPDALPTPPRTIARATRKVRVSRLRLPAIAARTPNDPLPPIEHARSRSLWGAEAPRPGTPPAPPKAAPPLPLEFQLAPDPDPGRPAEGPSARDGRSKPRMPPEIPPGAQRVQCPCGEYFIVRRRDVGHEQDCPGCAKRITFIETRDPQSLAPVIRARPVGGAPQA